jgi:hypothetical protein
MSGLADDGATGQPETTPVAEALSEALVPFDADADATVDATPEEPAAMPEPLPPLTVVSLGLELPPVLSATRRSKPCAQPG